MAPTKACTKPVMHLAVFALIKNLCSRLYFQSKSYG